jgi:hypothetical protein
VLITDTRAGKEDVEALTSHEMTVQRA